MRKLLIGFVALIVLAVAAVLIIPSFIDWNSYKAEIAAQVKSLTGRDLVIDGDIDIAVLPSPAVIANDVTFSNVEGGSSPSMVRLKSLAVNVALGPLLGGDIQITKVRLVEPTVILEVLADGRQNWVFEKLAADDAASSMNGETPSASIDLSTGQSPSATAPEPAGNAAADAAAGPDLRLDNFEIVEGTIIYRDARSATEERIGNLNATLKAASMVGPFESIGSLTVRGIPVSYEIGVDGVFQGRTVPVSALIRADEADASIILNGNIVNLSNDAKFTGKLKAEGKSLAALISATAHAADIPGGLDQAFSAEGDIAATASSVNVDALAVKLGEASANGSINASLADIPSVAVDLTVNHVNLDKFLAHPAYAGGGAAKTASKETSVSNASGAASSSVESDTSGQPPKPSAAMSLPDHVAASVAIGVDAITFRGEKVGPVRLNAELANGEITLSQFTTQLPGATDVAMFGFMSMQGGGPVFDGEAEISVGDTHSLTRWLQVDMPAMSNGRLRHVTAKAKIKATSENVQISGIDVAFDGSHLTGGVTVALRQRPAFGASFALDRIDLEGYLPVASDGTADTAQSGVTTNAAANDNASGNSSTATGSVNETPSAAANPLAVLSALTTFDANLKATIGEVVHKGAQIRNIEFDGTLFNGALTLKNASVADLAGASASLSGAISELGGNPRFGGLNAKFKAKSVQKLVDFLAIELPVSAKALGSVSTTVNLDGPVLQPSVKASLNAAGAQATFDGGVSLLPIKDMFDGAVTLKHDDVAGLLQAFGVAYQPSGKIGGLSLSTRLSGGADQISLENLVGALGNLKFTGSTTARLGGNVPKIIADIDTNAFTVDPFIPVQKSAAAAPQSFGVVQRPAVTSGAPWPHDPIDLSALGGLDGDLRLHSDAIAYGVYRFEDADVVASLAGGVLKVDHVTGNLFGGRVNVKGLLNSQGTPGADATMSYENASVSSMLAALLGQPTATGAFTFETALKASGASVADMVAALNGTGSFLLKGLDVKGSAKGTPLAGILGLVQSFGQLGAGLTGKASEGLADATGSFVMNKGVASIGDFRLASGLGDGSAMGKVDLANWQMDVSGTMKMAQNILGQLLVQKAGAPQELPFRVSGALDSPTVKLETASLGNLVGSGAAQPVLKKLEEKLPGVGGLLQGVLGGSLGGGETPQQPAPQTQETQGTQSDSQGTPEPQPQPQPQPQTPEAQPLTPENVLKQLLQF